VLFQVVRCGIYRSDLGLDEVAQAFDDLAAPEQHAKILIDPSR
jgi:hypothetical protein